MSPDPRAIGSPSSEAQALLFNHATKVPEMKKKIVID
jgi:hypothetical protein